MHVRAHPCADPPVTEQQLFFCSFSGLKQTQATDQNRLCPVRTTQTCPTGGPDVSKTTVAMLTVLKHAGAGTDLHPDAPRQQVLVLQVLHDGRHSLWTLRMTERQETRTDNYHR